ncbi:bestrophin-4 [Eurytemora carolleeae]|uniref:bestrophin-4 n=1 Tax=Eurytemora carolleeae TaxID=1294199 RepID=UPI000C79310F|nr:bestrophin-4 [Eurytemora carolleeae]|eukprot:XP_023339172.1 bestrophin-4-like [Eurytemora affinis]
MTVTYSDEVATSRGFGVFWKLLFRWKGSIYKLVWPNLFLFIVLYFFLSFLYNYVLDLENQVVFEDLCHHCRKFGDLIPITFVLGFYVAVVVNRWWAQFECIPWPDPVCIFVSASITGTDERGRVMRRTLARYLNLAFIQTLRMISVPVKKRFPTLFHLVEAGLITEYEMELIEKMEMNTSQHPKHWLSLVWCSSIITSARKEGRIQDDYATKTIIDELNKFGSKCAGLLNYDWVSVPLVYTQVVTLAVYSYVISSLLARQFLKDEPTMIVPVFTFLQFFFYMGWLKVAEALINPFGEDDDDFDVNLMIDRNIQVSYLIVDQLHQTHPPLIKDQFWDNVVPDELPYTVAAEQFRCEPYAGSAAEVEVGAEQSEFVNLETIAEEDYTEGKRPSRENSKFRNLFEEFVLKRTVSTTTVGQDSHCSSRRLSTLSGLGRHNHRKPCMSTPSMEQMFPTPNHLLIPNKRRNSMTGSSRKFILSKSNSVSLKLDLVGKENGSPCSVHSKSEEIIQNSKITI